MTKVWLAPVLAVALALGACGNDVSPPAPSASASPLASSASPSPVNPSASASPAKMFKANFQDPRVLNEASPMVDSSDPDWWLNSGGRLTIGGGTAATIHGELGPNDRWYKEYVKEGGESRLGSDHGRHPQNLFRLVLRREYQNPQQEFYFRVDRINLSRDPERKASNGVFAMSRYGEDGDTLYYAGVRVDGTAVIKKKIGGVYPDALAQPKVFDGPTYDRAKHPNLLPLHQWIGIRSAVQTNPNRTVTITLWLDLKGNGAWKQVAQATDSSAGGAAPITGSGLAGIRTDFMDATLKGYSIQEA